MRRLFIAGNWKMNMDLPSGRALVSELRGGMPKSEQVESAICPPSVYLFPMAKAVDGSQIRLGAQNCYFEAAGAFTGELSAAMIAETGCSYCIVGHSERRHTIGPARDGVVAGEDDEMVRRKAVALLGRGVTPIVCVGETLAQRDSGETDRILAAQIDGGLSGLNSDAASRIVVAYEPVWAIGTGRTATPEQAQDAHRFIRGRLAELFGKATADAVRILYGGSVKPDNAEQLMSLSDVDGALVGGASLKSDQFLGIIQAAMRGKGVQ